MAILVRLALVAFALFVGAIWFLIPPSWSQGNASAMKAEEPKSLAGSPELHSAPVSVTVPRNRDQPRTRPRPRLAYVPSEQADRHAARRSNWLSGRYKGGLTAEEWQAGRTHPTLRGELVRSRNEALIADHLHTNGHRYEYEPRVCGFRPDFYLPEHGIVIEYWGTQRKGNRMRAQKTRAYLQAGYRLVSLEPGKDVGLETDLRRQLWHKMRE